MDPIEPDTIAAISTAHGVGAIAVIRMSGPRALEILTQLAPELGSIEPKQTRLATVRDPVSGHPLDQALVVYNRAPDSYTGEDLVEISGHGGWLGPRLLLEACLASGARPAAPGEFTRRAYLNGRVDLVQAEAVADLVEGRSVMARRAALHQLDRGLSRRIAELRGGLLGLEAMLVHHLDFPDEDDPPVPVAGIADRAEELAAGLRALLSTAAEGELLREGALVVLAGRPNSGKSSLFNALIGSERAIVTDVPGTTRDALEASVSLGGFPFRLTDTAGLRETADGVERLGIEVARRYLAAADVVVLCAEAGRALGPEERVFLDRLDARILVARTKSDLADGSSDESGLWVSAVTGDGLGALREALARLAYEHLSGRDADVPVITRARQARGIGVALEEIEAFARELRAGTGPEVASARLRPAETALEELLGVITADDVLDRVFADFCIGK